MQNDSKSNIKSQIEQLGENIDNTIKGYDETNKLIEKIQLGNNKELKQDMKKLLNTLDTSIQALNDNTKYSTQGIFATQQPDQSIKQLQTIKEALQKSYQAVKEDLQGGKKTLKKEIKDELQNSLNQVKGLFSEAKQFLTTIKDSIVKLGNKTGQSLKEEVQDVTRTTKQDVSELTDLVRDGEKHFDGFKDTAKSTGLKGKLLAFGDLISNITDKTVLPYIAKEFFEIHGFEKETKTSDKAKDNIDQQIKKANAELSELTNKKETISQESNKIMNTWLDLAKQTGELKKALDECEKKITTLEKQPITNKKSGGKPLEQSQNQQKALSNSLSKVNETLKNLEQKNENLFNESKSIDAQISEQNSLLEGLHQKRNAPDAQKPQAKNSTLNKALTDKEMTNIVQDLKQGLKPNEAAENDQGVESQKVNNNSGHTR